MPKAIKTIGLAWTLKRISNGELPYHVAKQLGINHSTLANRMRRANLLDAYRHAKRQCIHNVMKSETFASARQDRLMRLHAVRSFPEDYPQWHYLLPRKARQAIGLDW
jgi:type I site-specific restriction endonuclease